MKTEKQFHSDKTNPEPKKEMKQPKDITKLKCFNCGDEFLRRNKKVKGRKYKSSKIRHVNCVTCCRKCSREYSRKGFKQRKEQNEKKD